MLSLKQLQEAVDKAVEGRAHVGIVSGLDALRVVLYQEERSIWLREDVVTEEEYMERAQASLSEWEAKRRRRWQEEEGILDPRAYR